MNLPARSAAKGRAAYAAIPGTWCIEGQWVTAAQIAARTGRSESGVHHLLRKLRHTSGPVTWKRLQLS